MTFLQTSRCLRDRRKDRVSDTLTKGRCWYAVEAGAALGLEESLSYLREHLGSCAHYDYMIGFSQGASVLCLMLARYPALVETSHIVLISPAMGILAPPQPVGKDGRKRIVIYGETDPVEDYREIRDYFPGPGWSLVAHGGSHYIPKELLTCLEDHL